MSSNKNALVIGVGEYENVSPLIHPANDAEDIAKALRALEFKVITSINPSLDEMENDILTFLDAISKKEAETSLIYYSGHGIQVSGENFLIPKDMEELTDERKIKRATYAVNELFAGLEKAANKVNIVILDACRDNPFAGKTKSIGGGGTKGLAGVGSAPNGTFIAYATSPGEVAFDGAASNRNGVFTTELLRAIQIEGLSIEEVFKEVRNGVLKVTRDKQKPWDLSSLTGNFYFVEPKEAGLGASKRLAQNSDMPPDSIDIKERITRIMTSFSDAKTIDDGFNQFLDFAKDFAQAPHTLKKAIGLKGDYSLLESDFREGIVPSSDFRKERREILANVNELLDEIRSSL
ncbi:MAG: caspase family protein [Leptospiraceae bacterium]|nr:caspase family protein [Leptospiraceae bacterium]